MGVGRQTATLYVVSSAVAVFACLGFAANKSLGFYFRDFQDDGNTRFVYTPDARGAWEYLETLGHPYVYFYNQRGSLNYETRIVLAPHIAGGEDRSREFTTEDKTLPLRYDLKLSARQIQPISVEPTGVVFVFLGTYLNDVDKVKEKYPGGISHDKFNEHYQIYDFRAYYLPPDVLAKYAAEESVTYEVAQTAVQQ